MWYPPWFDSFESFALSAGCVLAFGVLLSLARIQETLRDIDDKVGKDAERKRGKSGKESEEDE